MQSKEFLTIYDRSGKQLARISSEVLPNKAFPALKNNRGEMTRDIQECLQMFIEYYEELYSPMLRNHASWEKLFATASPLRLLDDCRESFDAPLQLEEISTAIESLKINVIRPRWTHGLIL